MTRAPDRRPGDILLDRYLPDANTEERERARAKLQEFARWLLEVAMDQVRAEQQSHDSRDVGSSDTMKSASLLSP